MIEDFKDRHRTCRIAPEHSAKLRQLKQKLAGNYNRYSCDNSSPTSIIDQMIHCLDKAKQDSCFIPWAFVFCDYSVSGLNSSRQGYSSYKGVLNTEAQLETTYIDDFTRAARDELEWWRLAALSKRLGKRMIGASDGFDLTAADSDIKITIFGLISRLFIKSLREKCKRGMRGAARRGTCLGKLPLGFTRRVRLDQAGNPVIGGDGLPIHEPCKDESTMGWRLLIFQLFVEKQWSSHRIARHFNSLNVDGWQGWTRKGIRDLLWSPSAIGVFIWNRTRREYDLETGKWKVVVNRRCEWEVYYNRELAIVPLDLWRRARRRLSNIRNNNPLTGRRFSRNEKSSSTLFSGTLFCAGCGKELVLYRSAGKYRSLFCRNGVNKAHQCTLTCSKSVAVVEKTLLHHLSTILIDELSVNNLVERANTYINAEAAKPRSDVRPLTAAICKKDAAIKKLFDRMESMTDEPLIEATENRIAVIQMEVNDLRQQLRLIEQNNEPAPPLLNAENVKELLAELPALLNQETSVAAEMLRQLTGPIFIRQGEASGQKRGGAEWIASFTPDFLGWLRSRAKANGCPDAHTLEYLCTRKWTIATTTTVSLKTIPKYESIAAEAAKLSATGKRIGPIAGKLGESYTTVFHSLRFARSGKRPKRPSKPSRRTGELSGPPTFQRLAKQVEKLRDIGLMSFLRIGRELGISNVTAARAYDHAKGVENSAANDPDSRPSRGGYSLLDLAVVKRIRSELNAGRSPKAIAIDLGIDIGRIHRVAKKVRRFQNPPHLAG